jgi:hypothetical protein
LIVEHVREPFIDRYFGVFFARSNESRIAMNVRESIIRHDFFGFVRVLRQLWHL